MVLRTQFVLATPLKQNGFFCPTITQQQKNAVKSPPSVSGKVSNRISQHNLGSESCSKSCCRWCPSLGQCRGCCPSSYCAGRPRRLGARSRTSSESTEGSRKTYSAHCRRTTSRSRQSPPHGEISPTRSGRRRTRSTGRSSSNRLTTWSRMRGTRWSRLSTRMPAFDKQILLINHDQQGLLVAEFATIESSFSLLHGILTQCYFG
jgi:hypothetical protein